jgi:hypothetical protein
MIRRAFDEDSAADIRYEQRQDRLAEEADEREAEDRAEARADFDPEPLDAWGRDADWNWPRGYGGGESVPW